MLNLWLKKKIRSLLLISAIILPGCIFFAGSPHDNFKGHVNVAIGKNIDEVPYFQLPHKEDLIDSKILPNGNIENKYRYSGTCRYFFIVDPKSRKIVGTRFEGKETDCTINP